jgi:hypothetical protein
VFGSVITITFQITFRVKIYVNDVFYAIPTIFLLKRVLNGCFFKIFLFKNI